MDPYFNSTRLMFNKKKGKFYVPLGPLRGYNSTLRKNSYFHFNRFTPNMIHIWLFSDQIWVNLFQGAKIYCNLIWKRRLQKFEISSTCSLPSRSLLFKFHFVYLQSHGLIQSWATWRNFKPPGDYWPLCFSESIWPGELPPKKFELKR